MFIQGSTYLYHATRKRAYFHEVTILIPKTWTSRVEYRQASNQSFDLADVIIAPPNPRWAPDPYTKQYQGCGKQGVHIHFWDKFLLDPNVELYYGQLGNQYVYNSYKIQLEVLKAHFVIHTRTCSHTTKLSPKNSSFLHVYIISSVHKEFAHINQKKSKLL